MLYSASISKLSALLASNESMEEYMQRTRMQSLNVWATEVHIVAAATMLRTAIYVFAPSGGTNKCLKHSPWEVMKEDCHQDESILLPILTIILKLLRRCKCNPVMFLNQCLLFDLLPLIRERAAHKRM